MAGVPKEKYTLSVLERDLVFIAVAVELHGFFSLAKTDVQVPGESTTNAVSYVSLSFSSCRLSSRGRGHSLCYRHFLVLF